MSQAGRERAGGYAAAIASAVLFGFIALLTTTLYGVGASGPEIVFWRLATAAIVTGAYAKLRGYHLRVGRAQLPRVLGISALYAGGVVFLCLAYGTPCSAGLASSLYHTYPLVLMLLAAAALHRRPSSTQLAVGGLALLGTALVLGVSGAAAGGWTFSASGAALALASALSYAAYSLALERGGASLPPSPVLFWYGCVVGAFASLPFMLAAPAHMRLEPLTVSACALLGVACTAVPYLLYISAVRRVGSVPVALLSYLEYPVTLAVMTVAAGEAPGAAELAGCALIALAGILTVAPARRGSGGDTRPA